MENQPNIGHDFGMSLCVYFEDLDDGDTNRQLDYNRWLEVWMCEITTAVDNGVILGKWKLPDELVVLGVFKIRIQ